jgi:agmatine deiminase
MESKTFNYNQPAEWARHQSCWLAWPSHGELWQENLEAAQNEFASLCELISESEQLNILVPTDAALRQAEKALSGLNVTFHKIAFGDIWLRDTAPLFITDTISHKQISLCFKFNGWGNKYNLPGDTEVAGKIADEIKAITHVEIKKSPLVLEGGSIDTDGEGAFLTTEQCLLNSNRNPHLDRAQIEEQLTNTLGAKKVIWLKEGLLNDHTDGHIDTIARFVAPGKVVCMMTHDKNDPNFEVLQTIHQDLKKSTNAQGKPLEVFTIPSPGCLLNEEDEVMPASYVNFYISNEKVIVPTYGIAQDSEAVLALQKLFPTRKVVGSSAKAILSGGGAFHCITQQQPTTEGQ